MIGKHIHLDNSFILFLFFIILTGNFNPFIFYFLLLFIHELGHAITGIMMGYKLDKISFYPLGGVTIFNLPLNISLKKELIILLAGPIFQIIGYFFLRNYYDLKVFHYTLLIFNLLPIYPLDGGKILNILLGYFNNYLKCFKITFIISIILLLFLFIYNLFFFNLNMFLMIIILLWKLITFYQKRFFYYERFLLERYLYHYSFKKIKNINKSQIFYRDYYHFIDFQDEFLFLQKHFKKN